MGFYGALTTRASVAAPSPNGVLLPSARHMRIHIHGRPTQQAKSRATSLYGRQNTSAAHLRDNGTNITGGAEPKPGCTVSN